MNATHPARSRLSTTARAVEEARAAWEKFRCAPVTAEDIADAQEIEAKLRAEQAALADGLGTLPARARLALLRLVRGTQQFLGLEPRHAWATGYLLGVLGVLAVIPLVLIVRPGPVPGAAAVLGAYFLTACLVSILLLSTRRDGLDATIDRLQRQRAENRARAADLVPQLAAAQERLALLRAAHGAHVEYDQAIERHRALEALLASERYQLGTSDWRSLRGIPFEEFVAKVFRALGYDVRPLKLHGQGADLIVTGNGRTIAVQTTGCADSVGNRAVQEVFAARAYHKCEECAVVTNSRFTSGAIDLATEVSCHLIDAGRIQALIAGDVF